MPKDKSTFSLQPKAPRDTGTVPRSDVLSSHREMVASHSVTGDKNLIKSNHFKPKTTTTADQKQHKLLCMYYCFK